MSNSSNNQGRAYEYATLNALEREISKVREVKVEYNSCYYAAQNAWGSVDSHIQDIFISSADASIQTIFELEPLILNDGLDAIELKIQPDNEGIDGDVRDVLIIRKKIEWEIGLSLKHNHFAVKHSRLAKKLDFGEKWFGVKCSQQYWKDVSPIFNYLSQEKVKNSNWKDLPSKECDVYIPLLTAFINELKTSYENFGSIIPQKMVEYLLGRYDFYKVIGIDSQRLNRILTFNLRGTLNQPSKDKNPLIIIPISDLPSRIISIDFKPNSSNTIELYLDAGWQFSFSIHNASTIVEPSLKFDIQLIGMPATIMTIDCKWI